MQDKGLIVLERRVDVGAKRLGAGAAQDAGQSQEANWDEFDFFHDCILEFAR